MRRLTVTAEASCSASGTPAQRQSSPPRLTRPRRPTPSSSPRRSPPDHTPPPTHQPTLTALCSECTLQSLHSVTTPASLLLYQRSAPPDLTPTRPALYLPALAPAPPNLPPLPLLLRSCLLTSTGEYTPLSSRLPKFPESWEVGNPTSQQW